MSDPISFAGASPRHGLPYLFAGQAQKEFYVNEAHAIADMLLHPAIEGEQDDPPASPQEGQCWLVGALPSGEWEDHGGKIACRQEAAWLFASPRDGMRVFDKAAGQEMFYLGGWHKAVAVAEPSGGSAVDAEARTAIAGLIAALVSAGVLPDN